MIAMRLTAVLLLLAVSGCRLWSSGDDRLSEWSEARARWEEQRPDAYTFDVRLGCFCIPLAENGVRVHVRGDSITALYDAGADTLLTHDPSGRLLTDDDRRRIPTLDALFGIVREGLVRAARTEVSYDATYGFPSDVFIDRDFNMADEEIGYTVTQFRPQQP